MLRPDKHSQARKTPDAHTKGNRMKIGKPALGLAFLLLAGAAQAVTRPVVMTETPLYTSPRGVRGMTEACQTPPWGYHLL